MWLNRQIGKNFREEYAIKDKILDVRSEHILELFRTDALGQIALFDESEVLVEKFLHIESELVAHIGACCIQERLQTPPNPLTTDKANTQSSNQAIAHNSLIPHNALIVGGFNLEIAYQLFKHDMHTFFVQSDSKVLDSLISFLPHFKEVRENPLFTHCAKMIDLPIQKYSLIIHNRTPNPHEIDALIRLMQEESIFIAPLPHPLFEEAEFEISLKDFGKFFSIVMPFFAPIFSHKAFVFASKRIHPLADFWLQKCDMIENLAYYNADIHEAAFALSTNLASTNLIKS
ncbi:spermine/spermidine synthase domain-containing protein [Helicobacter macacae]|uniref:Spermidine synthase n=1 Tax=Helicobacter macacae MIT 99-5501 TaxID=1357400 RepID=V8C7Q1_9HELI|nr:hypothetical protein [Helicobacter macacae]ETD22776.1 hypothetical protein HMPREF2086_01575 [Helicobacter macacae MIT 99-5501]